MILWFCVFRNETDTSSPALGEACSLGKALGPAFQPPVPYGIPLEATAAENLFLPFLGHPIGNEPEFLPCTGTQHTYWKITLISSNQRGKNTIKEILQHSASFFERKIEAQEDAFLSNYYCAEDVEDYANC